MHSKEIKGVSAFEVHKKAREIGLRVGYVDATTASLIKGKTVIAYITSMKEPVFHGRAVTPMREVGVLVASRIDCGPFKLALLARAIDPRLGIDKIPAGF